MSRGPGRRRCHWCRGLLPAEAAADVRYCSRPCETRARQRQDDLLTVNQATARLAGLREQQLAAVLARLPRPVVRQLAADAELAAAGQIPGQLGAITPVRLCTCGGVR